MPKPLHSILADAHLQMADRGVAVTVGALDANHVMPGLLEPVNGPCVTVLGKGDNIAVALHLDPGAAVAEIPRLHAVRGPEGADHECDRIARLDAECWIIHGMDGRRQLFSLALCQHVDYGKIVIDAAASLGDLQDLAVDPGLGVDALERDPRCLRTVGEAPIVSYDLAILGPRSAAVERDLFIDRGEMVWPRHGEELGPILLLIRLPKKGVSLNDAPLAGGLLARDVEVQVRPAAAAPLLAEQADELSHLDLGAGLDQIGDRVQMAVAIIPAALIEQIDDVIARLGGSILVAFQQRFPRRDDNTVSCGDHLDEPLGAADVEAVVIIDVLDERIFPAVNVDRFVGHLRAAGEPALPGWIEKRSRFEKWFSRRPEANACILVQAPGVLPRHPFRGVLAITLGNRAIHLYLADRRWQAIVGRGQCRWFAVDLHNNLRQPDGIAQGIARFFERNELQQNLATIG